MFTFIKSTPESRAVGYFLSKISTSNDELKFILSLNDRGIKKESEQIDNHQSYRN
jgi:hypothetical protein